MVTGLGCKDFFDYMYVTFEIPYLRRSLNKHGGLRCTPGREGTCVGVLDLRYIKSVRSPLI